MASNIAEDKQVQVQFKKKKKIVFVRCEAVIFDRSEVQKTCVYLAMAYLLVVRACYFAICIVKGLLQLLWYLLDKSWKGTSRMSLQNRYEPHSSSQLQGHNMLSEGRVRQIHTHIQLHFIFFFASHGRLSPQISFCDPHTTVFIAFSFFL